MKNVLIPFRQAYARDLAPTVIGSFDSVRVEGIVGTTSEAFEILNSGAIDLIVMGPGFIESAQILANAHPGLVRPVFIVLHRGDDASVRLRAQLQEINHVVSLASGLNDAMKSIHTVLHENERTRCRIIDDLPDRCDRRVMIQVNDDADCEIVRLVATGFADRDIAEVVHMSHQTIRNRISRIRGETGARNRTHLACLYFERVHEGLVPFETLDGPYRPVVTGL